MFLAKLADQQKVAFLNLAQQLVAADGIFSEDELSMMEQYQQEMNLNVPLDQIQEDVAQSIDIFKVASLTLKKQIIFELVGLACADQDYAAVEVTLLEKIAASFGLDLLFLESCKRHVYELMEVYQKIGALVEE